MQRDFGKYIVIKVVDAESALTPESIEELRDLSNIVDEYRIDNDKHPMECVVVERDWPEYETVWQMIADRVDGKQQALSDLSAVQHEIQPGYVEHLLPELSDEQLRDIATKHATVLYDSEYKRLKIQDGKICEAFRAAISADRELRGIS